eukprot:scaffold25930_cov63-Phaeocystis_antarctica.AAC.3
MDAPVRERWRQPGAGGEGDGNIADQLEGKQSQVAAGNRLCPRSVVCASGSRKACMGCLWGAHSLEFYFNPLQRVDSSTAAENVQLCTRVALQDCLIKRREGADGHLQLVTRINSELSS